MKKKDGKRLLSLWQVMALVSALILAVTISAIVYTFRSVLENRYERSLRDQLTQGLALLEEQGFVDQDAVMQLQENGIHFMILRESDSNVVFQNLDNIPLGLGDLPPESGGYRPKRDVQQLQTMVKNRLGQQNGSFFTTDPDEQPARSMLESRRMYLFGRSGAYLFCMYLPVESTNAAINLASRFTTELGIIGWLLSLVVIYIVARILTKPHREISKTARQIARLDFSQRCKGARTKELSELGDSINRMADRLQASVEDMRRSNEQLTIELSERIHQQKLTAELIANLSHDLKTPVAVISGYAEGLVEGVAHTPEQQQTYCSMILQESDHMAAIISRMLALTRVESGEIPLEMERFDLSALLDSVIAVFQGEIDRSGLSLSTDYARPIEVYTDYESIRQSVINYVQNAVFHINGGTEICVWTEARETRIRLCVANSSAPIPDQDAVRLWDKLYRGDNARRRSRGEAGLGLSIVKGNMERLGLGYGFYNETEKGRVVFWLELPPAPEEEAEDEPENAPEDEPEDAPEEE